MNQYYISYYNTFNYLIQLYAVIILFLTKGGISIKTLDLFFILLIINLLINFYTIYTFVDIKILHNEQGSKLKLKKEYYEKKTNI